MDLKDLKDLVFLMQGDQLKINVNDQPREVTPFVAAKRYRIYSQLGIGLKLSENDAIFFGLVNPKNIIQACRGMMVLEEIQYAKYNTPYRCWLIAQRNLVDDDKIIINRATDLFGGHDEMYALRQKVLSYVPNNEEVGRMIAKLRENGVEINTREFDDEMGRHLVHCDEVSYVQAQASG